MFKIMFKKIEDDAAIVIIIACLVVFSLGMTIYLSPEKIDGYAVNKEMASNLDMNENGFGLLKEAYHGDYFMPVMIVMTDTVSYKSLGGNRIGFLYSHRGADTVRTYTSEYENVVNFDLNVVSFSDNGNDVNAVLPFTDVSPIAVHNALIAGCMMYALPDEFCEDVGRI